MGALAYLVAALVIFAAGGMAGIKWEVGRNAVAENARMEKVREQERGNRAAERQQSTNVIEALNESNKRSAVARSAAAVARNELDGLRDDLKNLRANLPSLAIGACRERAATVSELFDRCAGTLEDLAGKAQRHADDTLTIQSAWPKQK